MFVDADKSLIITSLAQRRFPYGFLFILSFIHPPPHSSPLNASKNMALAPRYDQLSILRIRYAATHPDHRLNMHINRMRKQYSRFSKINCTLSVH